MPERHGHNARELEFHAMPEEREKFEKKRNTVSNLTAEKEKVL